MTTVNGGGGPMWTSWRKRDLMEKVSAPGVPSWALPGLWLPPIRISPVYPSCFLGESNHVRFHLCFPRTQTGLSPHRCPESCIYRIDPHRPGAAALNLGSGRLIAVFPHPGNPSWHLPPSEGISARPAPDPAQTLPGATDPAVFIAQHRVRTRPRIPSAAKFQGWK